MEEEHQDRSAVVPHLPNEVLIKIVSYIPLSRDLASAALACRNLNTLVQEFLYRSLHLNVRSSRLDIQADTLWAFERFTRLINRLSANYNLGRQTIALSLTVRHREWYIVGEHHRLLRVVPRLRHVTFSPPPLQSCIPNGLPLSSIRLNFENLGDHYLYPIGFTDQDNVTESVLLTVISRHLWVPSLRTLQLENLNFQTQDPGSQNRTAIHWMSSHSTVQDLRCIDCHDKPSGLLFETLLAKVEALKRFVFVSNSSAVFDGLKEHRRPSLRGISRGLIRYMAHLEEVVLSSSDGTYGAYLDREWYFDHCFTNLRRVALPKCLLVQDISRRSQCLLPRTLEELQIQFTVSFEDGEGSDQANATREANIATVEWVAQATSASLPMLNHVVWWHQPRGLDEPQGDTFCGYIPKLQQLRGSFTAVGVDFEWICTRLFKDTPFGKRLADCTVEQD